MQEYAPVLSLTIRDANDLSRILIGVRDPETNPTHPNVISTPTSRIPYGFGDHLLHGITFVDVPQSHSHFPERVHRTRIAIDAPQHSAFGNEHDNADLLLYSVSHLLRNKLGVQSDFRYTARLGSVIDGIATYDVPRARAVQRVADGQTVYDESIRMIGIEAIVDNLEFPASNGCYSALRWVSVRDFAEVMQTRSALPVSAAFGADSIGYCAHGLCLLSADAILKKSEK